MELNLEIGLRCTCGEKLIAEETKTVRGDFATYEVTPCPNCIAAAIEEAMNRKHQKEFAAS